jgi:hypothetical protein
VYVIRMSLGPAVVAVLVVGSLLPVSPAAAQQTPTVNPRCAQAAADVPEFGGAYVERRVLHVWLTESDAGVTDAVVAILREQCPVYDDVVIRAADYPYAQLDGWGTQALALPEVTMTSVDSRTNRLAVGVSDVDRDRPVVMAALADLGVPPEAVALRQAGPFSTQPLRRDSALAWVIGVAVVVMIGCAAALLAHRQRHRKTRS